MALEAVLDKLYFMKITGDYLIGYEGICDRCQKLERAYYYFADKPHQDLMRSGQFMNIRSNCPACVSSSVFATPKTRRWLRKLNPRDVANDLKTLAKGIQIDFNYALTEAKEQERMDQEVENDERRMKEIIQWAKKKS